MQVEGERCDRQRDVQAGKEGGRREGERERE